MVLLSAVGRTCGSLQRLGMRFKPIVIAVMASVVTAVPLYGSVQAQDGVESFLPSRLTEANQQMLLEADELQYDYDNDIVSAVGNVQIYYAGYVLEAQRVRLDRKTTRLFAEGNVELIEPDGNVVRAQNLELSDDFRDGFVNSLQIETTQRTRINAERATRSDDNVTTFENGTYSVYVNQPPSKPPLWQIKAGKIIHDQKEKVIKYKNTRIEFFGAPIIYLPYFSQADPSVKRKSGFLTPSYVAKDRLGFGVSIPYYLSLGPNYDATISATPLTKQGFLVGGEWRHKLMDGAYSIRGLGIRQEDPGLFEDTSGNREFRGSLNTKGDFRINERWNWGWDLSYFSDRAFVKDYGISGLGTNNSVSDIFLKGISDRNSFETHAYAFRVFQEDSFDATDPNPVGPFVPFGEELQAKQPVVHPVIDYNYIFDQPIMGGELSLKGNLTSLTRDITDAYSFNGTDYFRGVEGTFTRTTFEGEWRRSLIDPIGQVFTPFAYAKGDVFFLASADNNVSELSPDAVVARGVPAVGLEYRYPFVSTFSWGTQVIEPVGQIIARPDETGIGKLPNDDAQSLVFDASTLFEYDKFSGFDRSEGGTRANVGLQYQLQFYNGGSLSALIGQSINLAGQNSYAIPDLVNSTGDSGLESDVSDYVASLYFDTNLGMRVGANARFDDSDFELKRTEVQAAGIYGPVTGSLTYAFLGQQPEQGIDSDRQETLAAASVRLQENWRAFGSIRYDLENKNFVRDSFGLGYDDEGFSLSLSYSQDRSRDDGNDVDRTLFLRFGLRTLGDTGFSQGVGSSQ
ncbi:MAG: LPS-assembly protein LptD [Stappiaceae bacterium]